MHAFHAAIDLVHAEAALAPMNKSALRCRFFMYIVYSGFNSGCSQMLTSDVKDVHVQVFHVDSRGGWNIGCSMKILHV